MTSPPIGTDEELIERAHGIAFGLEQDCRTDAADVIVELSDALVSRISEVERLLEKLAFLDAELSCRGTDDGHYCPNCDRSLFDAKLVASAALSQHRTTG